MIFVDTSAVYALADRRDRNHQTALRRFDAALRSGRPLITHDYVLVESLAILQRRLGRRRALEFARDAARFEVEWVGEALYREALAALGEIPRVSLVDQVSFAVMRRRGIQEALAFDADFPAAGFRLFGAESSQPAG